MSDVAEVREPAPLSLSRPLAEIIEEAEDIAHAAAQAPTSLHLLLAFFTSSNPVERFLKEGGISDRRLLELLPPRPSEARTAVREIMERAAKVAASCGSRSVDSLHVLIGITRVQESLAYRLLEEAGEQPSRLRNRAMTRLTGQRDPWAPARADDGSQKSTPKHHLSRRPSAADSRHRSAAVSWTPPVKTPSPRTRRDPPPPSKLRKTPAEPTGHKTTPAPPGPALGSTSADRPAHQTGPRPSDDRNMRAKSFEPWLLPEDEFPWLTSLGRNLSEEAGRGELDLLVGRESEVDQLIDVLGKRRANNPCLVGKPGVGKTAIVEGLAARWVDGSEGQKARVIIGLDAGRLLMGTHLRGSFNERLRGLQDEVEQSEGRVLIFFDELHTLIGAGASGDGPLDAANELKAALARGKFPCIGATTPEEYSTHIAKDAALARRFVPILVEEPNQEQAETMLYRLLPVYAEHHGVGYTPASVRDAIRLSARFLPEQQLPDKAIALLDLAGSRAARSGEPEVDSAAVAALISERTGIPAERLLATDHERMLSLESELSRRVIGHEAALSRVAEVVRRHAAGFASRRPQGSFLLVGPSGVGKTETAKALAEILHGAESRLLRFDLSEFSEAHAVSRLVGAPPGYVGHDAGGQLTEAVRKRPGCVVLFDEVEKAHVEVLQVLLQVLDEGRLTDGQGRTLSFAETVLVMTSNLGVESVFSRPRSIGFGQPEKGQKVGVEDEVLDAVRRALPAELWARIDEKLYFRPLERSELRRVVRLLAKSSSDRLRAERGIGFTLDASAVEALVEHGGTDPRLGARPLRSALSHLVEGPLAARILQGRLHAGEEVRVSWGSRVPGTNQGPGGLLFQVPGSRG